MTEVVKKSSGWWKWGWVCLGVAGVLVAVVYVGGTRPVSGEQAVERVQKLPEVKEWMGLVEAGRRSRAAVVVDSQTNTEFVIHVFETFADHTATFNWYKVNKATGQVTKEF